jgi:hypothetical protein
MKEYPILTENTSLKFGKFPIDRKDIVLPEGH